MLVRRRGEPAIMVSIVASQWRNYRPCRPCNAGGARWPRGPNQDARKQFSDSALYCSVRHCSFKCFMTLHCLSNKSARVLWIGPWPFYPQCSWFSGLIVTYAARRIKIDCEVWRCWASNADSESNLTCRLYTHVRDLFKKIVRSFHAVIFAVGINWIDMLDGINVPNSHCKLQPMFKVAL